MQGAKTNSFTKLIVWQKAFLFTKKIYLSTKQFPREELYGIISQLKRAAVSVSSNIAEGFSRSSKKEKQQFLYIALGSLTECQNLLLLARELGFIDNKNFNELASLSTEVGKLLNFSISRLKEKGLS